MLLTFHNWLSFLRSSCNQLILWEASWRNITFPWRLTVRLWFLNFRQSSLIYGILQVSLGVTTLNQLKYLMALVALLGCYTSFWCFVLHRRTELPGIFLPLSLEGLIARFLVIKEIIWWIKAINILHFILFFSTIFIRTHRHREITRFRFLTRRRSRCKVTN